jgi:hypothetical protein
VSASLPNGTYSYRLDLPSNYSAAPRTGEFVIDGGAAVLHPLFDLVEFPTLFVAMGPGAPADWSVRLGNLTEGATPNGSLFLAPNGTYTFDVHAPPGYFATPSHGTLTVAGSTPTVPIQFHLSSDRPSAALVAALSSGALSVSLWITASILVGFAAVLWLRRGRGGSRS